MTSKLETLDTEVKQALWECRQMQDASYFFKHRSMQATWTDAPGALCSQLWAIPIKNKTALNTVWLRLCLIAYYLLKQRLRELLGTDTAKQLLVTDAASIKDAPGIHRIEDYITRGGRYWHIVQSHGADVLFCLPSDTK